MRFDDGLYFSFFGEQAATSFSKCKKFYISFSFIFDTSILCFKII